MQIALEVSNLDFTKPTGISRYMIELINEFSKDNSDKITLYYKLSRLSNRLKANKLKFTFQGYDEHFWRVFRQPQIIHGLDTIIPKIGSARRVTTIHDVFVLHSNAELVSSKEFSQRKKRQFQRSADYSDVILTVSETSRRDLLSAIKVSEKKVMVTHLGVNPNFQPAQKHEINEMKKRLGIAEEYLLFVGELSIRKNTSRLVQAFVNTGLDMQLILAGRCSFGGEHTVQLINKLSKNSKILWLNYVSDKDLPILYTGARGFVFPTLYEGFGLPVLEAMACETPALVGNKGACMEVSGGLATSCDPYNLDSISEGIQNLLVQSRYGLREKSLNFTWEKCARKTKDIYKNLI